MIFISVLSGLMDFSDIVMLRGRPNSCCQQNLKVAREDHFLRPGFLHIICVFLGYKVSNFIKKLDVTDV